MWFLLLNLVIDYLYLLIGGTLHTYLGGGKFRGNILQKTAYTHLEGVEELGEVQMVLRVCCKRQLSKGNPLSIFYGHGVKRVGEWMGATGLKFKRQNTNKSDGTHRPLAATKVPPTHTVVKDNSTCCNFTVGHGPSHFPFHFGWLVKPFIITKKKSYK